MKISRRSILGIGMGVSGLAVTGPTAASAFNHLIEPFRWDTVAQREVEQLCAAMQRAWNEKDLAFIDAVVADEGFLGAYDSGLDDQPVTLNSKAELLKFFADAFETLEATGAGKEATTRVKHQVRATSNFAVATQEYDLTTKLPNGTDEIETWRTTAVLIKESKGWQFLHFHVSSTMPTADIAA